MALVIELNGFWKRACPWRTSTFRALWGRKLGEVLLWHTSTLIYSYVYTHAHPHGLGYSGLQKLRTEVADQSFVPRALRKIHLASLTQPPNCYLQFYQKAPTFTVFLGRCALLVQTTGVFASAFRSAASNNVLWGTLVLRYANKCDLKRGSYSEV